MNADDGLARGRQRYGEFRNSALRRDDRVRLKRDLPPRKVGDLGTIEHIDLRSDGLYKVTTHRVRWQDGRASDVPNGEIVLERA